MRDSTTRWAGLGPALVSAVAFGGSGVAAKPLIQAGLDPLHVVWLRAAGAALVMLPLAWRHRALLRRGPARGGALSRFAGPARLVAFGLLGVAGVQACYFAAISRIPVGVALLVEYLAPAVLLLWIRFVQRRTVTRTAAVGAVLAAGGLACVVEVWSGLRLDALGLLLALAAACCQVGYFLLADHSGAGDGGGEVPDPLGVVAYGLIVGALVLTAVARPWNMRWSLLGSTAMMHRTEVPAWLLLCWIVLIATVLAYLTGVVSVRRLSPQVAGVVANLEAVVATVLAWVLLAEHLSMPQIVGGAVVLLGAFVAQSSAPKRTGGSVKASGGPPTIAQQPLPEGPLSGTRSDM